MWNFKVPIYQYIYESSGPSGLWLLYLVYFCSMEQPGVLISTMIPTLPGWDATPSQGYPQP